MQSAFFGRCFLDCQKFYTYAKPQFPLLLQQHIDLYEIVPTAFRKHFYAATVKTRNYPLNTFLWALIIQHIFSISTDSLLLVFLQCSRHPCEFCSFNKIPDISKITRFKQDFLEELQAILNHLIDFTELICPVINPVKAAMTIFDSYGIEAWVAENHPKYANRIIKQFKAYAKAMHFEKTMPLTKQPTVL